MRPSHSVKRSCSLLLSTVNVQRRRLLENAAVVDGLFTSVDNLGMDQLLAIRAFSRVVEAGNFTKAADSLRMPKATVSKLVQTLEAHLGVQLLQRTTRRVAVTPDGA